MSKQDGFSLRRLSPSSAVWYASVIAGWILLALAVHAVFATPSVDLVAPLIMISALVVLLELIPLIQGRGHDPQGVVMSTAFTCALLIVWGLWPAVIAVSVAAVVADLRARKAAYKVLFNPAQYSLSLASSYLVMRVAGYSPSLAHPLQHIHAADMVWIVGVWLAYFVVNLVLVAGVLTYREPFRTGINDDLRHVTTITFCVLALSPVIVDVGQSAWPLLPLLLVPLLLLYYTAQLSLEREHAAGHDALTGLPNRTTFQFDLDKAINHFERDGVPFGLMLIDLDDFKVINDTLGHQVGDELLTRFAHRLRESVRPNDRVARLGGDEFGVIVFDADEADVRAAADRIRTGNVAPLELNALSQEVDLSLGIAVCPAHGTTATILLRRADVAMYVAKESRTSTEFYSPEQDDNSTDRLSLLSQLRQAVDDDTLELHYQPKVSTRDYAPLGVEALVRWFHPIRGYIAPEEFLPLAERSGLMPQLTARVVALALDQIARWRDEGIDIPVAVNVAPTDLIGDSLTYLVAQALSEYHLPAGMLQLEITERIVADKLDDAQRTLGRLRAMGVLISLDDFGTGQLPLARLGSLAIDEIKIDRVFIAGLSEGARGIGIVQALIDLAHALGVRAIAEGVENQDEWRLLHTLGCDGVQGWYVAMPMPAAETTQWLRAHFAVRHLHTRPLVRPRAELRAAEGAGPAEDPFPDPSRDRVI